MNIFKLATYSTLIVISAGCARMVAFETPYDKNRWWDHVGGYEDEQLSDGIFKLKYTGNGVTSLGKIVGYWHRRARELCKGDYTAEMNSYLLQVDTNVPAGTTSVPISYSKPIAEGIVKCK